MATPLHPKQVVTVQELAISSMLELETSRQLLFEKGIISEEEFLVEFKKLDRTTKGKRRNQYFKMNQAI
jgi:hypothetical protein